MDDSDGMRALLISSGSGSLKNFKTIQIKKVLKHAHPINKKRIKIERRTKATKISQAKISQIIEEMKKVAITRQFQAYTTIMH
jgi:uncharacterized protein YneF (UPF0154 family)